MNTSGANGLLDLIKEQDIRYLAFRFTDPHGKWQHTSQHVSTVDEDLLANGHVRRLVDLGLEGD